VIVVGGSADSTNGVEEGDVETIIRQLLADGAKPSRAARDAAAISGISGADAYDLVRRITREGTGAPE